MNGATDFLLRFLCGEDESLFEDLKGGPKFIFAGIQFLYVYERSSFIKTEPKSGIQLGTVAGMFRIEITVSRGKANFQLHGILGRKDQIQGPNLQRLEKLHNLGVHRIKKSSIPFEF